MKKNEVFRIKRLFSMTESVVSFKRVFFELSFEGGVMNGSVDKIDTLTLSVVLLN